MLRAYRIAEVVSALVVTVLFLPVNGISRSLGRTEEPAQAARLGIELASNKQTYELGEPIEVTLTLKNSGEVAFLASSAPSTIQSAAGGVLSFVLIGPDGKPVEGIKSFGEWWGLHEESLEGWIDRTRRLYLPGDFVGFSRSLEGLGYSLEKPGVYHLQATYWETDYTSTGLVDTLEIRRTKKKLLFPLWVGTTSSNTVTFEIRP